MGWQTEILNSRSSILFYIRDEGSFGWKDALLEGTSSMHIPLYLTLKRKNWPGTPLIVRWLRLSQLQC